MLPRCVYLSRDDIGQAYPVPVSVMIELPYSSPVGQPLPPQEHAISVSLPTWADTLGYKQGEEEILSRMQTGYPRYFVHMSVRKVR